MKLVAPQRSAAVRNAKDSVDSLAVAEPVNRSVVMPSIGSSEKLMAMAACGLTKKARIMVMSVSPSTVVDIALLALGASMTTRIQMLLPLAAARRVEVEITPS